MIIFQFVPLKWVTNLSFYLFIYLTIFFGGGRGVSSNVFTDNNINIKILMLNNVYKMDIHINHCNSIPNHLSVSDVQGLIQSRDQFNKM